MEKKNYPADMDKLVLQFDVARIFLAEEEEEEEEEASVVLSLKDITAREKAEEALKSSEARLHTIIEKNADGIVVVDKKGTVRFVNHAAEALFGRKREELLGEDFGFPIVIGKTTEINIIHKGLAVAEMRVVETEWEGERVYLSSLRDISNRKQMEKDLRIKDNAIDSSINGIGIADLEGYLTYVNKVFLKMWGYDEKEVIGKHILDFCQKEKVVIAAMEELSDEGWRGEMKALRKDGSLFYLESSASMVKDEDNNSICMMVSFIDITERKQAEMQIQQQLQRLSALRNMDMAIIASLDLRVTLNIFLDQVTSLGIDAAAVLLLNPGTSNLEYAVSRGFRSYAIQDTYLRLGKGLAGRAVLERRIVNIPNLAEAENGFSRSIVLAGEKFIAYYAVPLIAKGDVRGVLEIFQRSPLETNQDWLDFLESLAAQAAIAIDNASLFDNLQRSNMELVFAYDTTLEGWSKALDMRDKETEGHSQRVTDMTLKIARALGVSEAELVHVRRGALLHDIGKMGIPDNILLKPVKLTDEEWEIMRKHPVYAYELLSPIAFLRPALDIPYCHHEKWDGTGYPRGLKGEQIPLTARIFAVADVCDALRSDRPYCSAWPEEKVKEYLIDQAGKHFDPKVVEVFLKIKDNL